MIEKTILLIDDSLTIRRLVDRELGSAGYRVLLAENAELGLATALSEKPDLILLDHQLPGTTGSKVCAQLLANDELRLIPVVVSSTLRKKAYIEYTDFPNVVDQLPKPYTGDLLRTTVANALDTASLIVQSQAAGTAIPEVIEAGGEADLAGTFSMFTVRELIDFLNNGNKKGLLELECERTRVCVFLDQGRIQAVTASGIKSHEIAAQLPASLIDLAPMMKFTISGRRSAQLDGLVELLDNKVLDARLLKQLLRHQAAVLLWRCFQASPKSFRFDAGHEAPSLFVKLPLDISLLSVLVDAARLAPPDVRVDEKVEFVRQAIRGQNLDRAGLSGLHMKLLSLLNSPQTASELSIQAGCSIDEVRWVMRGFELAEIVSSQNRIQQLQLIALCSNAERAQQLNHFLQAHKNLIQGRVVRDALAVKLLLRRSKPDVLLFDLDQPAHASLCQQVRSDFQSQLADAMWFGLMQKPTAKRLEIQLDGLIAWDRLDAELRKALNLSVENSNPIVSQAELADCV